MNTMNTRLSDRIIGLFTLSVYLQLRFNLNWHWAVLEQSAVKFAMQPVAVTKLDQ